MHELIRECTFTPLTDGRTFQLQLFDVGARTRHGKWNVGYSFGETTDGGFRLLFEGEDFATPRAIDSDVCVCALMGFLTLRPGDTDAEYFATYTAAQHEWTREYACEVLSGDVSHWEEHLSERGCDGDKPCAMTRPWSDNVAVYDPSDD